MQKSRVDQYYLHDLVTHTLTPHAMPSNYRPQARNWLFVINNPTDEDTSNLMEEETEVHYAVWQLERGECGTPHLQGYLAFKLRKRLSQLKKNHPRAHFKIARGTPQQNQKYCTKDDGRISVGAEFGDIDEVPRKGERSDLAELQTAFDSELLPHEYATDYFEFFLRYPRALENYHLAQIRPRVSTDPVYVTLLIGNSGTGKSYYAERLARQRGSVYRHALGNFWDGYRGEPAVIFDDFRGCSISYGAFKRVCDRYPLLVHVKGSSANMAATHFYITTNFKVEDWWDPQVTGSDLTPIFRRITDIYYFPEKLKFAKFKTYREFSIKVLTPRGDRDGPLELELQQVEEDQEISQ